MTKEIDYPFWTIIVILFSVIYLVTDKFVKRIFKITPTKVSYENAKNALDKICSWTTWLTGIQTAAIAAMPLLGSKDQPFSVVSKNYGFSVLLLFGASIILSTWLLSSIPSIQQRLNNSTTSTGVNDIYEMRLFSRIPVTLGRFAGLVHTFFLIGIIFFALFIFSRFKS